MKTPTTESVGINPEERELSYQEGDLLDEYFGDANMNLVTSVMDIIVQDAIKRGIPQEGILAFFQWNINTMWRYVDLHDHQRWRSCHGPCWFVWKQRYGVQHCGTAACDPPTEEE